MHKRAVALKVLKAGVQNHHWLHNKQTDYI